MLVVTLATFIIKSDNPLTLNDEHQRILVAVRMMFRNRYDPYLDLGDIAALVLIFLLYEQICFRTQLACYTIAKLAASG